MNILITGIHGFVGSNLVAALKDRHTIFGLDIISPEKEGVQKTYAWHELDQIPSVDAVIHLAGKAHDTKNSASPQDYFDINVGLTKQIFDYYIHSGAQKFIFFSSVKAVADEVMGDELNEDAVPNPKTPYGQSKLEAEEYIWKSGDGRQEAEVGCRETEVGRQEGRSLSATFPEQRRSLSAKQSKGAYRKEQSPYLEPATRNPQLLVYLLRPCMIHGPGNKGNLNLLYQVIQKGIPWPLGAFENQRSFCAIDNLLFVVKQLIERPVEPGIYQVADDEPLSTNELIQRIAASLNRKPRIWKVSKKWITVAAVVGGFLHLPLNRERLQKLTESYVVSNQKLKKALGIERMPHSTTEGLKKTLASFDRKQ